MLTEMTLVSGDYPGLNVETPIRPLRLLDGANSQRAPYPAANSQFWLVRTAPAQDMSLGCASYARIADSRILPFPTQHAGHPNAAVSSAYACLYASAYKHPLACMVIGSPGRLRADFARRADVAHPAIELPLCRYVGARMPIHS